MSILFAFFYLITIIFSLLTIIIIVHHCHSQRWSIVSLLTCNSCISLLVYTISFCTQFSSLIQNTSLNSENKNKFSCKIVACLGTFGVTILSYSSMIQAISRFFIIILYKYQILLTFRIHWIMIIISWIVSGIIAGSLLISPAAYQYEDESRVCALTRKNFLISFLSIIFIFIFPMIIITILYGIIIWHIKQHNRIDVRSTNILRAKRNITVFKNIFIFTSILGIGGTPYLISTIVNRIVPIPWPLYSISFLFIACTSAVGSIAILLTYVQSKAIFCTKFRRRCRQGIVIKKPRNKKLVKINPIAVYYNKTDEIEILPANN
ncbi:unnamed protein product [Rotaria sordida]|uniref:G-protein coupled receptors family 1 profile domain-containing protein n=1 Tax=Rotaria sordida TaxID=392033 RepID=A0A819IK84_9BILA|nr:unnamed protein product [Rotaria sordida]CAF3919482.1 unnamed protein product [Rotaria sordida]